MTRKVFPQVSDATGLAGEVLRGVSRDARRSFAASFGLLSVVSGPGWRVFLVRGRCARAVTALEVDCPVPVTVRLWPVSLP